MTIPAAHANGRWVVSSLLLATLGVSATPLPAVADTPRTLLSNDAYTIAVGKDGALMIRPRAGSDFAPRFTLLYREDDPKIALRRGKIRGVMYNVPSWEVRGLTGDTSLEQTETDTSVQAGDGFDTRIQKGGRIGRTADLFRAAGVTVPLTATPGTVEGRTIRLRFPEHPLAHLDATLQLPTGVGEPRLSFTLEPRKAGWFSVGYTGAPSAAPARVTALWQPLIWQEQRLPSSSFLTAAFHCPIPATLVTSGGVTSGVIAEPKELPFQPLPTFDNSRFGVALRDGDGDARPMLFAPMLGGVGSQRKPGENFTFSLRLVAQRADLSTTFERLARGVYGFHDFRENAAVPLNRVLENMIGYGMSPFSRFNEELKGCAYDTDAPGTVKNVSALHPLSAALVTDDDAIFRQRAYPILEFLLSREKFLFAVSPDVKIQSPSWRLLGPCAPLSELTTLYAMTHGRSPLLLRYAENLYGQTRVRNGDIAEKGGTWQEALALYEATGDAKWLAQARSGADAYLQSLAKPEWQQNFPPGFFWNAFTPDLFGLSLLYDATRDKRYRDAATDAARQYVQFTWMAPAVPDAPVAVNEGGKAPVYWYLAKRTAGPMPVPAEEVPAWRLSEIGLTCESSGTSSGHRAVFLASYAPWFLRLAQQSNDPLLHDVARSAVVGRYESFPGYHMNTARTTVYEKANYPLHPFSELSYNSFHFNHVWPHVALVLDYLVSDVTTRSGSKIDFPARYAEGYAYIKSRIYGDRPGKWYGDNNVWLYLPKGLLTTQSPQLNYVAGRGENALYIALTNQSARAIADTVRLDRSVVPFEAGRTYTVRVCEENGAERTTTMRDGVIPVRVVARGITSLKIEGLRVQTRFQSKWAESDADGRAEGWAQDETRAPLVDGNAVGMTLNLGPGLRTAYVYLQATYNDVKEARLRYTAPDGKEQVLTDTSYPYEFTVALPPRAAAFDYKVEVTGTDGKVQQTPPQSLRRTQE